MEKTKGSERDKEILGMLYGEESIAMNNTEKKAGRTAGVYTFYQMKDKREFMIHPKGLAFDGIALVNGETEGEAKANAQFIVTACNSHDQLVEACKKALLRLSTCEGDLTPEGEKRENVEEVELIESALRSAGVEV